MKLRLLLVCVAAAMLSVSAAIAAPPPGKGKPQTGEGCKPKVTVVLKGSVANAGTSALTVNVASGNRWGRAYVTAGSATVAVSETTKVRRQGKKTLVDLVSGDRVLVQAKVCKADLAEGATPALTAVRVIAHPATS